MTLGEVLQGLGRLVAYYPGLARFLGGAKSAILFCQLFYWSVWAERKRDGWFWKSLAELREETGLTTEELRSARKELKSRGVIEARYRRLEHRLYFRVNSARLEELWLEWTAQNGRLGKPEAPHRVATNAELGKAQVVDPDPEITSERTSENARKSARARTVDKSTQNPEGKQKELESEKRFDPKVLALLKDLSAQLARRAKAGV